MSGLFDWLSKPLVSFRVEVSSASRPADVRGDPRPAFGRADEPQTLDEIVGLDSLKNLLRIEVAAARREGRRFPHALLLGPAGCGKTVVLSAIVGEMRYAPFRSVGSEFKSQTDLLSAFGAVGELHAKTGRTVGWIVDEIDGLDLKAGYVLHDILSYGWASFRGQRYGASVTIFAASNRPSLISPALRSRFEIAEQVDYYSLHELSEIARRAAMRQGFQISDEAAAQLAANSAGEPRKLLGRLLRVAVNTADGKTIDLDAAREALALSGLHPGGLSTAQVRILEFLSGAADKTAGISSLSAYLGFDTKDTADEERWLIRQRLLEVTRSGRRITEAGEAVLRRREHEAAS